MENIQTPILIGEPTQLDHPEYIGTYRMTRILGNSGTFLANQGTNLQTMYKNAGKALAEFHRSASNLTFKHRSTGESSVYTDMNILKNSNLSASTNHALAEASNYLQANKQNGIIHGDFHSGNVLFNEHLIVTGIIDFGVAGKSDNIMNDFCCIKDAYLPDFIRGYEENSDIKIDCHMITATHLSMLTNNLSNTNKNDTKEKSRLIDSINKQLNNMSYVIG